MTQTADKLKPFLATSAVLHVSLFALVVFGSALFPKRTETPWGNNSLPGVKVGVAATVPGIPLPSPRVVRDDAKPSDTKTLHPAEVAPKPSKAPSKPADVKIPARGAKPSKSETGPANSTKAATPPSPPTATNVIPGPETGQVALPYGQPGGQATVGGDGTFGNRFPEYVTAMTTAINAAWTKPAGALTRGASQRVYVTFKINRQGGSAVASDMQVDQASGSAQLDRSAVRAITVAKLPPLPRDYSGSSVDVRFYFDYKQ